MKRKKPKLTPVEWEVMEAVWAIGGAPSVRDVLERAYPRGEKAYTTVQTVMNTLERKGLLRRKKTGLVNFYEPARSRRDLERDETASMIRRVFGGSPAAMASALLSLDGLGREEIDEIKRLVARKERELGEEGS
ncbi:MAG: BlaI/MecI/CopY family transcriptional regulator [Candidatus Krumholzibacteriota bacterium]|nr:BlaI/MecI/CopY family transcriptional regulator [Candidatus Krumholzibacteriota bacterium]